MKKADINDPLFLAMRITSYSLASDTLEIHDCHGADFLLELISKIPSKTIFEMSSN